MSKISCPMHALQLSAVFVDGRFKADATGFIADSDEGLISIANTANAGQFQITFSEVFDKVLDLHVKVNPTGDAAADITNIAKVEVLDADALDAKILAGDPITIQFIAFDGSVADLDVEAMVSVSGVFRKNSVKGPGE